MVASVAAVKAAHSKGFLVRTLTFLLSAVLRAEFDREPFHWRSHTGEVWRRTPESGTIATFRPTPVRQLRGMGLDKAGLRVVTAVPK